MQTRKWVALAPMLLAPALAIGQPARAADDTAITIVLPNEPDTVEPCRSALAAVGLVDKQNVTETLLNIDPSDAKLSPRLATAWKQIDPKTWQFTLRQGVTFSDGTPFNAAAVVYNVERSQAQGPACDNYFKGFAGFKLKAEAVDDYTVNVTADQDAPIMPIGFSVLTMASPKMPMEPTREPVGTGPYKLSDWVPGDHITLVRNDDYWGGKPEVSQVTYVFRAESAVRAAMVSTGEADIALAISTQDANNPKTDFSYLNSETTHIRIDERIPPLDDVRLRQALNYAVDRNAMLGTVVNADSIPAGQLPGPNVNGYNPDVKPYPYDPDKAKELIAAAAADGVDVKAAIRLIGRAEQWANVTEFAQALESMFQAVGLNVKLEMMERAREISYQSKPFPPMEEVGPNIILESSDNNMGDASFSAFNNYHSEGSQSTTIDPEMDALIDKANTATGEERTKLFQQIFDKVQNDIVASVVLFYMMDITRVAERLDWKPSISTNSEIDVSTIKFKH
jgi:peptide/nickel transport system substrate-binding protein